MSQSSIQSLIFLMRRLTMRRLTAITARAQVTIEAAMMDALLSSWRLIPAGGGGSADMVSIHDCVGSFRKAFGVDGEELTLGGSGSLGCDWESSRQRPIRRACITLEPCSLTQSD